MLVAQIHKIDANADEDPESVKQLQSIVVGDLEYEVGAIDWNAECEEARSHTFLEGEHKGDNLHRHQVKKRHCRKT